jgi:hypothetical protein
MLTDARQLLRDRVFVLCFWIYLINRLILKPHLASTTFAACYLNDLLLIPVCLPPVLALYRLLGIRRNGLPPTEIETLIHVFIWSAMFELILPLLSHRLNATADRFDVVAYAIGAAIAQVAWRFCRQPTANSLATA